MANVSFSKMSRQFENENSFNYKGENIQNKFLIDQVKETKKKNHFLKNSVSDSFDLVNSFDKNPTDNVLKDLSFYNDQSFGTHNASNLTFKEQSQKLIFRGKNKANKEIEVITIDEGPDKLFEQFEKLFGVKEISVKHNLVELIDDESLISFDDQDPKSNGGIYDAMIQCKSSKEKKNLEFLDRFTFKTLSRALKNKEFTLKFEVCKQDEQFQIKYVISSQTKTYTFQIIIEAINWVYGVRYSEIRLSAIVCGNVFSNYSEEFLWNQSINISDFISSFKQKHSIEVSYQKEIGQLPFIKTCSPDQLTKKQKLYFKQEKFSRLLTSLWKSFMEHKKIKIIEVTPDSDEDSEADSVDSSEADLSDLLKFNFLVNNKNIFETACSADNAKVSKDLSSLLVLSRTFGAEVFDELNRE